MRCPVSTRATAAELPSVRPDSAPLSDDEKILSEADFLGFGLPRAAVAFLRAAPASPVPGGVERAGPMVLEAALLWDETVLEVKHLRPGQPLVLGETADCDLLLPLGDEEGPRFTLVRWTEEGPELRAPSRWSGLVAIADAERALSESPTDDEGYRLVALGPDRRVALAVGDLWLCLRAVHPGAAASRKPDAWDRPFLAISSVATALMAMVGLMIWTAPPPMENEVIGIPDRFAELLLEVPPPAPVVKQVAPKSDPGEKAPEPEGRAGEKTGKRDQGDRVRLNRRQRDMDVAREAGVLGALDKLGDLDGALSDADLASGLYAASNGLMGAKGVGFGNSGLGSRGGGLGGGGEVGSIGSGLGGHGRGRGEAGWGEGGGEWGRKPQTDLPKEKEVLLIGSLEKAEIDAVMKRALNQFRHCYSLELQRDQNLAGKVTLSFTIAADGTVSQAGVSRSSMNNANVESCLASRLYKLQFPQPRGGGIVKVSYPFYFSS